MGKKAVLNAQTVAIAICIAMAIAGASIAIWGAVLEASGLTAGAGLVHMVVGAVIMGFAGIVVSLAGKLLGK